MTAALPNSLAAQGRALPPLKNADRGTRNMELTTPGGGKSTGELIRQSNRWRDNYNALRSLTIARVVSIIEAAERGDFAELQLVMRKLERRYPVLKGLKARRLAALEKLDWDIKIMDPLPEGASEAQAAEQQKFLRSRYELIENLTEAFGFLVTPEFRGYAILQKHRFDGGEHDGAVRELHWLPQDQFSRAGQFGDFYYNPDSRFGIGGDACAATLGEASRIGSDELPREEFVIREVDAPLYEIALIAFVNWAMGRKDHSAFVEIFGLPNAIVIMPANIPPGQEDDYRASAEKVADGVSGALPYGSDAKFPTAGIRGSNAPFKEFCDCQDADVVLAGTGGRLAMLTADKGGLGDGPAQEHQDAFDEIAQADARKINAVLQRDFDRLELAQQFPGQPRLAYFELCAVEEEDASEVIANIAALKGAGYKVRTEQVEEKTGYELEEAETQGRGEEDDDPINNRRLIFNYDPSQPRDDQGQWTDGALAYKVGQNPDFNIADADPSPERLHIGMVRAGKVHDPITGKDEDRSGWKLHPGDGEVAVDYRAYSAGRRARAGIETPEALYIRDKSFGHFALVDNTPAPKQETATQPRTTADPVVVSQTIDERVKSAKIQLVGSGYSAPEYKLHGYRTERQLRSAIKRKLSNRSSASQSPQAALAEKIDPVADLLNRITQIKDDAQMIATLEKLLAHGDALAAIIAADVRRQQAALESQLAPELAKGLNGQ